MRALSIVAVGLFASCTVVNTEPLPLDAVVTVEPGVYLEGRGGVRIEDDVHLSADGAVLLSDGTTDLLEVD